MELQVLTKHQKPSMEADVKFVGTWEFTASPVPTVTHKAVHEFVQELQAKNFHKEVKTLLPADQTDLKDGSQVTPTQPSQTEVKTTEGTWSFKSYDKTSETINGSDVKFIGTWELTATPVPTVTHKAVHEFVSGTPGKELPQEVEISSSGRPNKLERWQSSNANATKSNRS